ncbi:hypothetical protein WICPIJ_008296 [Wickerhamomyces pijperi]|uniref:Uncharacterized protein n=1 Tax=Wickerhamomyces pijperi TaxID=599730 RepID=A0A9P8PZF7_WICPI|nr:hypothetical protein WICPIJ_008296 [Wickerhamomyces pijperi]
MSLRLKGRRQQLLLGALALTVVTSVGFILYNTLLSNDDQDTKGSEYATSNEDLVDDITRDEIILEDVDDTVIDDGEEEDQGQAKDLSVESNSVLDSISKSTNTKEQEDDVASSVLQSASSLLASVKDINEESYIQVEEDKKEDQIEGKDLSKKPHTEDQPSETVSEVSQNDPVATSTETENSSYQN